MSKKCVKCKEPIDYVENRNGLKVYAHKYGYCKKNGCLSWYYLNDTVGQERLQKATLKATKSRRELEEAKKEHKISRTLTWLKREVQKACHRYVRQRDRHKPCISCGAEWHSGFQAGHYYKAELYSLLKYLEANIHGQCPKCNIYDEGALNGFRLGLILRYGEDYVEALDELAMQCKQTKHKWDRIELREKLLYFQKLCAQFGN